MGGRATGWLVAWLLLAAAGQVLVFEVVRRGFVETVRGQLVDTTALDATTPGRGPVEVLLEQVLGAVSVLTIAAAVAVIGFIALIRGRILLAGAATMLVVGANLTTQLLKYTLSRPDLGIDPERAVAGNSLPSGHTTVAGSLAVALVLVLPPQLRGIAAVAGAGYAALSGVATMSADWHRPSDSVTALLVVGAWAALAGLLLALRRPPARTASPHRTALGLLGLAAAAALAVAALALVLTDRALAGAAVGPGPASRVDLLSRAELLTAYAGGAAGIAGVAAGVMAVVLLTVHLVVPDRDRAGGSGGRPAAHPAPAPARPG